MIIFSPYFHSSKIHPCPYSPDSASLFLPLKPIKYSFCFLSILTCVLFSWCIVNLPEATHFHKEKRLFSNWHLSVANSFSYRVILYVHLPWVFVWIELVQVWARFHNFCEFICATTMLCPENTASLHSCTDPGSLQSFHPLSNGGPQALGERG